MKNCLNREGLDNPYNGKTLEATKTYRDTSSGKNRTPVFGLDLATVIARLDLKDGATVSFHHHMRNGDLVMRMVLEELAKLGLKSLTVASSSFFPCHEFLVEMMRQGIVTSLHCSYMSGPVAKAVSEGVLQGDCTITTHGGRPRAILEGELALSAAFLAAPTVDRNGNATGSAGKSACGVLGYAVADALMAQNVVLITDNLLEAPRSVDTPEITGNLVDYVVAVNAIGDPKGIVSGTTQMTKDPVGLRIAADTAMLLDEADLIVDGFSFQTGAGGISLAVAEEVATIMRAKNVKGSFASGGITDNLVSMLEEGLFEELQDVQCFTLGAVKSIQNNHNHHKMSASIYANPLQQNNIVDKLDVVILGVSEIDLDFNVNVTTGSDGYILGGSGGHADTAAGAKFACVVSKLVSSRRSVICESVTTITTPGSTIDALVTDRGIVINPKHTELIKKLKQKSNLNIMTMQELYNVAIDLTGVPQKRKQGERIVAKSEYRDGTVIDVIYQVESTKTGGRYEF